jgi:hypothetical protein
LSALASYRVANLQGRSQIAARPKVSALPAPGGAVRDPLVNGILTRSY